jgi:NAD(P)-dependent dehydrogenase (short-subunit alcohol dehydrogenase family)
MATSQTLLMTGATSGLGLKTVEQLAKQPHLHLIVGARNPGQANALRAAIPSDRLTLLPLDLASRASVCEFTTAAIAQLKTLENSALNAIALNAGIQITAGLEKTADGYERTFATNYLGHFLLVAQLLTVLADNSVVISTASGTHDPRDQVARQFGFRGGFFPSAEAVAEGALDDSVSVKQQGLDRYATSKLCTLLYTYEMARRIPAHQTRFLAFDPGLMPGTGLARDRSAGERFAWTYLMPRLRWVIPGTSSPAQSARSLAKLLTDPAIALTTGFHLNYQLRSVPTSDDSYREDWQRELYAFSARVCVQTPYLR